MQFVVKHTDTDMWAPLWDISISMKECHPSLTPEDVRATVGQMVRVFGFENEVRANGDIIYIRIIADVNSIMKLMNALEWLQNPNVH